MMSKSNLRAGKLQLQLMLLLIVSLMVLHFSNSANGENTGQASYYTTYTPSACYGDDTSEIPSDHILAAGGDGEPNIWQNGEACGKYYTLQCVGNGCKSSNSITVKIVDHCPGGCLNRAFDLSYEAFNSIADPTVGVITVQYS